MIIEAGYELLQLLEAPLFRDDDSRRAVWALGMDENLRELFIEKVRDEVPSSMEALIPDLERALQYECGHAAYYALAHTMPKFGLNIEHRIYEEDKVLRFAPELASHELLGRLVFAPNAYYSSAPRYSFRDYPLCEDLPRAAVIPGAHRFLDCDCLACTQHADMLARNRERAEALADPEYPEPAA